MIYDSAHSDFAGEYVESVRDPLEVTRVLPSVPFQLFMAPGSLVMLHPEPTLASSPGCVISHHPAMVDAAEWLFSVLWGQALPWTVLHPEAVHLAEDTMDPRLIGLLSAGEPDSAIARICGISERTVARQVAQLMVQVDAETRCELGFRLAERQLGWQRSAR